MQLPQLNTAASLTRDRQQWTTVSARGKTVGGKVRAGAIDQQIALVALKNQISKSKDARNIAEIQRVACGVQELRIAQHQTFNTIAKQATAAAIENNILDNVVVAQGNQTARTARQRRGALTRWVFQTDRAKITNEVFRNTNVTGVIVIETRQPLTITKHKAATG